VIGAFAHHPHRSQQAEHVQAGRVLANRPRGEDVIDGWRDGQRNGTIMQFKTVEQGAATSVLVATAPQLEGIGGRYFEDCNEAVLVSDDHEGREGVRAYALDPEGSRATVGRFARNAQHASLSRRLSRE
jgi:hypothetical protein